MCWHPHSQDATSPEQFQSTQGEFLVTTRRAQTKPVLSECGCSLSVWSRMASESHLTYGMFSVSGPKSFFQNTPKCQCAAIYHHLETGTVIYSCILGFAMTSNRRAHMSVLTLSTVSWGGGRTGVGMKDKNTLTVHCTACHSGDRQMWNRSTVWTGTLGFKTEPPWNKASSLRLGVLNPTQEKVFIRLQYCKWIRADRAKSPHGWNKR